MSNTTTTIPTHSAEQFTEPTAPDYAVPDPKEAWERLDRLVSKVLQSPTEQPETNGSDLASKKRVDAGK